MVQRLNGTSIWAISFEILSQVRAGIMAMMAQCKTENSIAMSKQMACKCTRIGTNMKVSARESKNTVKAALLGTMMAATSLAHLTMTV